MSVCISVFADLCLLCSFFLCVLTHVCLYVPHRYHTHCWGKSSSKPKSDSLYSALCDIFPFIFPLRLKSKSLLSLAQLSPLEVSLAKKEKKKRRKKKTQCVWMLSGDTLRYKNDPHQLFFVFFINGLCIISSAVCASLECLAMTICVCVPMH